MEKIIHTCENIQEKYTSKSLTDCIITFFEFLLILTIIIDCNSVYRSIDMSLEFRVLTLETAILSGVVLIGLFVLKDRENIKVLLGYKYLFIFTTAFILIFNAFNVTNFSDPLFLAYVIVFFNVMLVLFGIYKRIGKAFHLLIFMEHIVLFLAVVSVFLWFGSSVLELWGRNPDLAVSWGGSYYDANYLNFCIRRWIYNADLTKNLGIFTEPPMFGLFLGFGLYTEMFLKKKSNPLIIIMFLIAIASNRATLAMMISLVALFFKFLEIIRDKKYAKLLISLSFAAVVIGVVVLFFYKKNTGWGSFSVHLDDFAAAIKCWLHYPIFGCGYNAEAPIREYMSEFRLNNQGLSNSAAVVLAEGGILLFTYYIIPFIIMISAYFRKNRRLAFWGIGMFFMFVVVIFHTRLLIFLFMALGYSMIEIKRKKSAENAEKLKKVSDKTVSSEETGGLKKGRFTFRILEYDENLAEDKKLFNRKILDLPEGLIVMMGLVLLFLSVWGIVYRDKFSTANMYISIVIVLFEISVVVFELKNRKPDKTRSTVSQIAIWIVYLCIGQPYRVSDHFLTTCGLRIQDSWWKSIVLIIVLYGAGLIVDTIKKRTDFQSLQSKKQQ